MNRTSALVVGVLYGFVAWSAALAADSRWSVEAGAAQVAAEGIRSYAVPSGKFAQNDRDRVAAGFVRAARDLGEAWSVGLSYTRYGQLRASGYSGTPDIFNNFGGGGIIQVVIPLEIAERVQEWSFDGRRRWQLSPRWSVEAGPVVSYFHSSAELGSSRIVFYSFSGPGQRVYSPVAKYHGDDLRLGVVADMKFALSARWSAQVSYRYASPPDRDLHLVSVGIRRGF